MSCALCVTPSCRCNRRVGRALPQVGGAVASGARVTPKLVQSPCRSRASPQVACTVAVSGAPRVQVAGAVAVFGCARYREIQSMQAASRERSGAASSIAGYHSTHTERSELNACIDQVQGRAQHTPRLHPRTWPLGPRRPGAQAPAPAHPAAGAQAHAGMRRAPGRVHRVRTRACARVRTRIRARAPLANPLSSHSGAPWARAHCSSSRWPAPAASLHVCSSHGAPWARAHCSSARWPPWAAPLQVLSFHGAGGF